jgi:hypothetical protein
MALKERELRENLRERELLVEIKNKKTVRFVLKPNKIEAQ